MPCSFLNVSCLYGTWNKRGQLRILQCLLQRLRHRAERLAVRRTSAEGFQGGKVCGGGVALVLGESVLGVLLVKRRCV